MKTNASFLLFYVWFKYLVVGINAMPMVFGHLRSKQPASTVAVAKKKTFFLKKNVNYIKLKMIQQ